MSKRLSSVVFVTILICAATALTIGAAGHSHSARSSGVIDPTCTSSGGPCIQYTNNSSGPGIEGLSLLGSGIVGQTDFKSTSASNGKSGIFGSDMSTSGSFDSGVSGLSVRGIGVSGTSTSGPGLVASSSSSFGISASSKSWVGANVTGGAKLSPNTYPALSVVGDGNFDLIDVCNTGTNPCHTGSGLSPAVFRVTSTGDIQISGFLFTAGSCSSGCARTPMTPERRVRFFTPRESLPTVEDFGEAQLVNGQAYVRIDPAFANTVDSHSNYLVFITPEGNSRGLYVTSKTLAGFAVRENQGGRSTLPFSYRIVAKPYGENEARLQMFTMAKPGAFPIQSVFTR